MRVLSGPAIKSTQDVSSDEVWLLLMEINHESLSTPKYFVNNTEDIISDGVTYQAFPFKVVFGQDTGDKLPSVRLTFDNITRELINLIGSITDSPNITIKLILASSPDITEVEISELKLRNVDFDQYTLSGTLYSDDILNQRYPKDLITPASGYIGLFA